MNFWLWFNRCAVAALIFSLSGASVASRSYITWENPLILVILFFFALVYFAKIKAGFGLGLVVMIFTHVAMCLIQYIEFGSFHPKHLVLYPFGFFIAYAYINELGKDLFYYLEDLIINISIVANILWLVDVLSNGMFRSLINGFHIIESHSSIVASNLLLYVVVDEGVKSFIYRNSGFAWEPGAYAVISSMALMINLFKKVDFKINWGTLLLVFSIISSQSTTGYIILSILLSAKIFMSFAGAGRLIAGAWVVSFLMTMSTLPFMQSKIVDLWEEDFGEIVQSASADWNAGNPIAAQRFLSFKMDYDDFKENPIIGYGGRNEEMLINKLGLNLISVSGIGKLLAQFGIIGFLLFVACLLRSSVQITRSGGLCGAPSWLLAVIMFAVLISYSIFFQPLLIIFCFYGVLNIKRDGDI